MIVTWLFLGAAVWWGVGALLTLLGGVAFVVGLPVVMWIERRRARARGFYVHDGVFYYWDESKKRFESR